MTLFRSKFFLVPAMMAAAAMMPSAWAQTVPVSLPASVNAAHSDFDATVAAATADALGSLRRDVFATRMLSRTTVADFIRQTGAGDELSLVIARAQQIGPPRWIDDQTCQVKLELSGGRVAQALVSIADNFPTKSPVGGELLARELRDWRLRSFTATGSASGAERVFWVRPTDAAADAWKTVDEPSRKAAIVAAKQSVAGKIIESIKASELSPGKSVGDALAVPAVKDKVIEWIHSRPVTSVRFQDDRSVVLTLAAPSDGLAQVLAYAVAGQKGFENADVDLARLQRSLAVRMAEPTGTSAAEGAGVAAAPVDFRVPATPPDWVFRAVDADAAAPFAGSRLLTARSAEDKATENLRGKILSLPFDDKRSIGDVAKTNPSVHRALSRAMLRARVFKAEYQPDGGVTVKISLDPRMLWDELTGGT